MPIRRISRLQIETGAASNNDILVVEGGNFVFKNLANVYAGISPNSNVEGNIRFTGSVTANSFASTGFGVPTVSSATSINLNANGANGGAVVVQNSALRLRSYTNATRSNLTPSAGDVIYNSNVSSQQVYNGTSWNTTTITGPVFYAYVDPDVAAPSISSGSQQKITLTRKLFDSDNCFNNSKFTPSVPGYYQLNATVRLDTNSGDGELMITIWKNGAEYSRGWNNAGQALSNLTGWFSMSVSTLANANGTSDYFEVYVQHASGASKTITRGQNISYFNGCMIRGL